MAQPAEQPHPPVLIGGNGPGVLDRVLAFGDAWFPNHARNGILDRAAELRARAAGRSGSWSWGCRPTPRCSSRYAAAGFARAVHWLPSARRGPVEQALDRWEAAVAEFNGE